MSDSDTSYAGSQVGGSQKQAPDWGRFGLSDEQRGDGHHGYQDSGVNDEVFDEHHNSERNELFREDSSSRSAPWYKSNFFISEPVLFGTWDGVFTSCMINIFGVVIFLRTGWMVGNAGIGLSVLIIFMTIAVALIAALSAIGVCERCKMESGGVYFLLSHVLGARVGASVGIIYCFGQAVACSLYVVGFGESIAGLLGQDNVWVPRAIGAVVILALLGINVAGVKWVIRLQLILLMVLFVAMLDFLVGSFVHTDPENGFYGYSSTILSNNSAPQYLSGESFFSVFGVFFPTATGVFAGINMSGDLYNPGKSIPLGTVSAVGVSTLLYLIFALVLGATCAREALQTDYLIAEKVSILGFLFLAGLYISSISSCMGGLYGSPRILQCIANEGVVPFIKVLGQGLAITRVFCLLGMYMTSLSSAVGYYGGGPSILFRIACDRTAPVLNMLNIYWRRGPNKVPVFALIVITLISLLFVVIGKVNTLGPIVTMPFMFTYAAVDYAYFVLAMSYERKHARERRLERGGVVNNGAHVYTDSTGTRTGPDADSSTAAMLQNGGVTSSSGYGAIPNGTGNYRKNDDLDNLFPERTAYDRHRKRSEGESDPQGNKAQTGNGAPGSGTMESPTFVAPETGGRDISQVGTGDSSDTTELINSDGGAPKRVSTEITRQPRSFYSIFCNRWLSLVGCFVCLVIMFAIQWVYAIATVAIVLIIYIYIGQANPGVFPGIADFSMFVWLSELAKSCCRRGPPPPEQIVVTPNTPAMSTRAAQLTEDNEDFAERGRYHQSEVVKGENFDDPYNNDDS